MYYLSFFSNYLNDIYCYRYEVGYTSFNISIPDIKTDNNYFTVYPNPGTDNIIVENTFFSINNEGIVSIYNIHGQLLIHNTLLQKKSIINISNLEKGIYLLKLSCSDKTEIKRFVKE
jgi:hypothetical protein